MRAIWQSPTNPMPLYCLADSCQQLDDMTGWHQAVELALSLEHETHEQSYYCGRAKIRMGDWSGWIDYDGARHFGAHFKSPQTMRARMLGWSHIAWDGESDLADMTLLAICEQGFGDTIQMLRFAPDLSKRAKKVILAVQESLVSLARHNFGHLATIVAREKDMAIEFDCYTWLLSLPALIGFLPTFVPLEAPQPAARSSDGGGQLEVGLCWAGLPAYGKDKERTIPISAFEPLFARDGVRWHSLQVGAAAADADAYSQVLRPQVPLLSFADTANLIAGLDCVVAVDTAVCHLAGSMGIPTLLPLNTAAVWRWGLEDTTPWYPTMRLFRQRVFGDWVDVVASIAGHLDRMLEAKVESPAAAIVPLRPANGELVGHQRDEMTYQAPTLIYNGTVTVETRCDGQTSVDGCFMAAGRAFTDEGIDISEPTVGTETSGED